MNTIVYVFDKLTIDWNQVWSMTSEVKANSNN